VQKWGSSKFFQEKREVCQHHWWKRILMPLTVIETPTQTYNLSEDNLGYNSRRIDSSASHASCEFTRFVNRKMPKLVTSCCDYHNVSTRVPCGNIASRWPRLSHKRVAQVGQHQLRLFLNILRCLCAHLPCVTAFNLTRFSLQLTELFQPNGASSIYPFYPRTVLCICESSGMHCRAQGNA